MTFKVIGLLLSVIISFAASAQDYTPSKTRKMLSSHEWELKYLLVDDKRQELSESMKGTRLVFMPSKDMIYEYKADQKEPVQIFYGEIFAQHFKYEKRIEASEQTMDMDELAAGRLVFSSEFEKEDIDYVYERGNAIKGKGYPSLKYEVIDLDLSPQRMSPLVTELVKTINDELKKTSGHLFFFDKNKDRYLIKEAKLEPTEYGVKFSLIYDSKTTKNRSYSYEFNPVRIKKMEDLKVDADSKVGQIRITMDNEACFYTSGGSFNSIINTFNIDYLKENANSYAKLKEKLETLSDYYEFGRASRVEFFARFIDKQRKIWLSIDGTTTNYQLLDYDLIGNKLYLYYNWDMVNLTTTDKGSYLTIVPLKDITSLTVEATKSNPKTMLLRAKKKGFETYLYSDKKYVAEKPVFMVPLFNFGDGLYNHRVYSTLQQLIAEDGGDKLKVTYNP